MQAFRTFEGIKPSIAGNDCHEGLKTCLMSSNGGNMQRGLLSFRRDSEVVDVNSSGHSEVIDM